MRRAVLAAMFVPFAALPAIAFDPSGLLRQGDADFGRLQQDNKRVEAENARRARENAAKRRAVAPPAALPCYSNDTCHEVLSRDRNSANIRCTKGIHAGAEKCVSSNGKGDWAAGCSLTYALAHHHSSLDRAADAACR